MEMWEDACLGLLDDGWMDLDRGKRFVPQTSIVYDDIK